MSAKRKKQIECLERYSAYTSGLEDITEFLFSEKLLSKDEIRSMKQSPDYAKEIEGKLYSLQQGGKIQMLEYEWILLPVERIKIHIITDSMNKEFSFNY